MSKPPNHSPRTPLLSNMHAYTAPAIPLNGKPATARCQATTNGRGGAASWGAIDGLQVFSDLKDAPAPTSVAVSQEPPMAIKFKLPEDQIVSMAIDGADGKRLRNFPARVPMKAGEETVGWDLKDDNGALVKPGTYAWKAITHGGLKLRYEMTPYPNVSMVSGENSPWLNGHNAAGGWMADHTPPRAVAAGADRVFLSSQTCESGVAVIECDLDGRKHWGYGNIIAWTGPAFLAADGTALYGMPQSKGHSVLQGQTDYVWRFTQPDKKLDTPFQLSATATRRRGASGLAARDGKLYVAVNAGEDWMENAFPATDVDQDHCEPRYAKPQKSNKLDAPDPRADFLRLLRLTGTPPGGNGLTQLTTIKDAAPRQHIVVALEREAEIGSFVFPLPEVKGLKMTISVLKRGATYPPNPQKNADWQQINQVSGKGWIVLTAPDKTVTRAVRLSCDTGLDEIDDRGIGDIDAVVEIGRAHV